MEYIVTRDATVTVRGTLLRLSRGTIVTDVRPPSKFMTKPGVSYFDEALLDDLVGGGAPLTEVGEGTNIERCPHCSRSFVSTFAMSPPEVEIPSPVLQKSAGKK